MPNNGDETIVTGLKYLSSPALGGLNPDVIGIGNFHKTLPHNEFGEVDPAAYAAFVTASTTGGDYESIPRGPVGTGYVVPTPAVGDKFNNPQAARAHDKLTGPATDYQMPPAPRVRSLSTAAEMTELQWMALLRDLPFINFATEPRVTKAIADISSHFSAALAANEPGGLQLGTDLPRNLQNRLDLRLETLFRCGLLGEDKGPIISQFFLHDIAYGAQFIQQTVRPYAKGLNFLTDYDSWIRAQNAGLDKWADGYADDNNFMKEPSLEDATGVRHLSSMRDVSRFVNKDALHQAYFNAALLCLNWGVPFDAGNPYATYQRQGRFGTFGGPDLLTRVSEVAGRALAVVWHQKWEVHRRLRPEAYGGLMQMQAIGYPPGPGGTKRAYGLPDAAFTSEAAKALNSLSGNYFLPMAFTAGSPPHPAYGAGHATVAGACVTVLKAWLAEKTPLKKLLKDHDVRNPYRPVPPDTGVVVISQADAAGKLAPYTGADVDEMTVEGELNKIACNVAMGRSMGGVHWRSDNTRSLRLGEQLAVELLRSESQDYAERRLPGNTAPIWTFTSFNGNAVTIYDGKVLVNSSPFDPKSGPL